MNFDSAAYFQEVLSGTRNLIQTIHPNGDGLQMNNQKKFNIRCAMAVTTALFAMSALAQQAASGTASPAGDPQAAAAGDDATAQAKAQKGKLTSDIQTVVVTAQKRKEDPNKIAMSISAVSGEDIKEQHIADFTDLTRSIPNISFTGNNGAGPGLENIEMRGVSSSAGSSTVSVYMDDTSVTVGNVYAMGTVEPKFFDLDHVEVLRGPQGTLYGDSSMGGTIKFIANQPDLKYYSVDTFADYSYTKNAGSNTSANIVGNIPLIPNELAIRIGVQGNRNAGFINQVNSNGEVISNGVNSMDDQEVRFAVKWKPTKDLTILPTIYYQEVNSNGNSAFDMATLPAYETSILVREPSKDRLLIPNLTVNYDMDGNTLTSVSSYFERKFNRILDGRAYTTGPLASTNPTTGCYFYTVACGGTISDALTTALLASPSPTQLTSQVEQFSQELRLASKAYDQTVSPWTWVGGLYYSNQRTGIIENDPIDNLNATLLQYNIDTSNLASLANGLYFPGNPALGIAPGTPYLNPFPNNNTYYGDEQLHTTQSAIFGETNYYFSPTLHATVGLRYMGATRSINQVNALYTNDFNTNAPQTVQNASKSTASTPKFALTWDIDPTDTVYTSAAKGYRLGGGNEFVPPGFCAQDLATNGLTAGPLTYNQDSLWSYEVGDKSRFLNNRVSLTADVFYLKWNNIQQYVSLPNCGYEYNTNAGDATSRGAEMEVKFKPVPQVLLGASAGYNKAVFSNSAGQANGVLGAIQGAAIEGVPKYNTQLSAKYNFSVWDDKSAFVLASMHWIGSSHGSLDPTDPDYNRPAYHTLDASTGVAFESFELSLYIKNALDDKTIIQRPSINEVEEGYRVNPRTIGMNVTAHF